MEQAIDVIIWTLIATNIILVSTIYVVGELAKRKSKRVVKLSRCIPGLWLAFTIVAVELMIMAAWLGVLFITKEVLGL